METKPIINPVEAVIQEMGIAPIKENVWAFGSTEKPTKETIKQKSEQVMSTDAPLETFLEVKFMEKVVKEILENKEFRKRVKEDYLNQSGGEVTTIELFGIKVAPMSQEKKLMLEKVYIFSEQVNKMEKEIEEYLSLVDLNKQAVKLLKTIEINNGTAKEVTVDSLFPEDDSEEKSEEKQVSEVDKFNLQITFKGEK